MEILFSNLIDYLSIYNHGTNINEALQIIEDYDGTFSAFTQWITKVENDLNYLEDYCLQADDNDSTKQTAIDLYKVFKLNIYF